LTPFCATKTNPQTAAGLGPRSKDPCQCLSTELAGWRVVEKLGRELNCNQNIKYISPSSTLL
jgi:hypothetical protein